MIPNRDAIDDRVEGFDALTAIFANGSLDAKDRRYTLVGDVLRVSHPQLDGKESRTGKAWSDSGRFDFRVTKPIAWAGDFETDPIPCALYLQRSMESRVSNQQGLLDALNASRGMLNRPRFRTFTAKSIDRTTLRVLFDDLAGLAARGIIREPDAIAAAARSFGMTVSGLSGKKGLAREAKYVNAELAKAARDGHFLVVDSDVPSCDLDLTGRLVFKVGLGSERHDALRVVASPDVKGFVCRKFLERFVAEANGGTVSVCKGEERETVPINGMDGGSIAASFMPGIESGSIFDVLVGEPTLDHEVLRTVARKINDRPSRIVPLFDLHHRENAPDRKAMARS